MRTDESGPAGSFRRAAQASVNDRSPARTFILRPKTPRNRKGGELPPGAGGGLKVYMGRVGNRCPPLFTHPRNWIGGASGPDQSRAKRFTATTAVLRQGSDRPSAPRYRQERAG
jgi:hypothetical protein